MRKWALLITLLFSTNALADYISGDMTLRDAIYVYGMQVNAKFSKSLVGINCDVLQVVLDVDSGFTDIGYAEINNINELQSSLFIYKDRIFDFHKMFSYSLYKNKYLKEFVFGDNNATTSSTQIIGSGTFFAYCYSTKPGAYVYLYEGDKCQVKFSNGATEPAICY